jgi:hypothetical protein
MATAAAIPVQGAPSTLQPDQFPLESEKFADNGSWFAQYIRWIAYNFYNYNVRTVFPASAYNYYWATDVLENFSYYYGEQRNLIFAYASQLPSGQNIPAPFIAGQQIRNFVDNMNGNVLQMVKPIGDSISCKNMDYEDVLDKMVQKNIAKMTVKAKPMLDELAKRGMDFQPTDKQYTDEAEVDEDFENQLDEYEDAGIKIIRSIYYDQDLESQFSAQDGLHQFVGGISGTIIERKGDKVCHTHVPSYNCIYDYRAKDSWGKDALIGGAVILMTPEEINLTCPDLTHEELEEIRFMAMSGDRNAALFRNNLNAGWNNIRWWGNDGRIAVVRAFWVSKRDLRNYRTENSLGQKSVKFYDDKKTYQTDQKDEKGKVIHKYGSEMKGENWTWDICTGYLIGNRYVKQYGYAENVIKDTYGFPYLPFHFFSHNLVNGYSKSIVSRLKPLEAEYDRIMLKIREKMGRDFGKFFMINGKKAGIDDTIEILNSIKTQGGYVTAGDQNYMSQDGEKLFEVFSMELDNIEPYIQMLSVLRTEMQQTVSISDYALGMQTETVGKGVQQQSIQNSTLANTPLYEGLKTFWKKKLQYSLELAKQFIKEGQYAVVVSKDQVELLSVTKKTLSKNLGMYFVENDALNDENKKFLRDYLFNLSQNAQVMQSMGIEPVQVLDLIESYTYKAGKKAFKRDVEMNKKKYQEQQSQQQQAEGQMTAAQQQQAIMLQAQIKQIAEDNSNFRNTQNNETKLLLQQNQNIMDALQILMQGKPDNPILNPAPQAAPQQ